MTSHDFATDRTNDPVPSFDRSNKNILKKLHSRGFATVENHIQTETDRDTFEP